MTEVANGVELFLAVFYGVTGLLFWTLFGIGLARNTRQSLIAIDQWLATVLIPDSYADETISAWAHRTQHKRIERCINLLFFDDMHCAKAYLSEMTGAQSAKEYRND